MEFFEASASWMVALGKTLVHSLWLGLLLLSVLKIILQFLPGRYSLLRYRMATVSLFVYIGLIIAVFFILYAPLKDQLGISHSATYVPLLLPSALDININSEGSPVLLICALSSYIYFTGILVMLIRSILSFSFIRQMKRHSLPVQGNWYDRFHKLKLRLGIRKSVNLQESDRLNVPVLVGLLKPAIIVPAGMFTHLSVDQVETILMHELHHLKRLDFLVNIIQLIVEGLFFYNPAVWSISRVIRTERENCCDDHVIQSCGDPLTYAKALFQLAGHHQPLHQLLPGAAGTDQFQLLNRIKRILNQTTMKTNIREKLFSLTILAAGMLILLTISGFSSGFSIIKHQDSRQDVGPSPSTSTVSPVERQLVVQDTLPRANRIESKELDEKELEAIREEVEAAKKEALESIDWDEIKEEMEAARLEAMESVDWEEIRKDMEAAKLEAMESVDWEEIKKDMEAAKLEAMESIDWEEMKKEMAQAKIHMDSTMQDLDFDFDMDFDMEKLQLEIEKSMKEIEEIDWEVIQQDIQESMEELDWETIQKDIQESMEEVDWETIQKDIQESIEEIDWEEIQKGMEHTRIHLDSMRHNLHTE